MIIQLIVVLKLKRIKYKKNKKYKVTIIHKVVINNSTL
jgi:hypothetical protein